MFKNLVKGALIGAAALTLAAPAAQAADITVNLFGASAQYEFWTSAAPAYLDSVCTGAVQHAKGTLTGPDGARDTGVAKSTSCGSDNLTITYTTFSSINGIKAVANAAAYDGCATGWAQVANPATASYTTYPAAAGTVTSLVCADIHIGASDVAGETFGQESHGQLLGPNGGGYVNYTADPVDTGLYNLKNCRPINVPFAFFAHKDTVIFHEWDLVNDTFWGPYYPWWEVETVASQTDLTRLMATAIFGGQVNNWDDFGYPAQQLTVCLRHAGSGTHATLDAEVLRGDANLLKDEVLPTNPLVALGLSPVVYFNKGSSDMMKCIRNAGAGAIGYADADKNGGNWNGTQGSYGTVWRLEYGGADAIAYSLINGVYDFWSAQWLYYRNAETTAIKNRITALCNFAANANNMPDTRRAFWTTEGEMKVTKADDFTWPVHN